MIHALVHYPDIDNQKINRLRRKYDPQFNLIGPHITIIFPVSDSIERQELIGHVREVLRNFKPFVVNLNGLEKSCDDYLFLLLQQGAGEVLRLHEAMYTGILAPHRQSNTPFTPHVTLGKFGDDPNGFSEAMEEAGDLNLDYNFRMDRVHLIRVNDERTKIEGSTEFLL